MTRRRSDAGFTLVELLVVIIIIGILAAIAIPAFLNQRQKGFDATLKSDIKGAVTALTTVSDGESWANFNLRHGVTRNSVVAENKSGAAGPVSDRLWANLPNVTPIPVSEGTFLEMVFITRSDTLWDTNHPAGEFCIKGSNIRSSYDKPWSPAADAAKSLYYDSMLGKTLTIEQLEKYGTDPKQVSCYGFVKSYRSLS